MLIEEYHNDEAIRVKNEINIIKQMKQKTVLKLFIFHFGLNGSICDLKNVKGILKLYCPLAMFYFPDINYNKTHEKIEI